MRTDIRTLQQELGTTAIYVTHDQVEAMTMADRIMLMNAGRIEQIGAPLDLYDHPGSKFVAGFVGSPPINLIDGEINSGPASTFISDGIFVELPEGHWPAGQATLGIRPEDMSIAKSRGGGNALGTVGNIECTGDRSIIEVKLAGGRLNVSSLERWNLMSGSEIDLDIDVDKCHFFGRDGALITSE